MPDSYSTANYREPISVTATGSVQGDAAPLVRGALNTVSGADGTKGVVLPTPVAGSRVRVYNEHATLALKVYPPAGCDINDGAANASVNLSLIHI